jgi:hypothetical protein
LLLSGFEGIHPTEFDEPYISLLASTYILLFGSVIPFAVILFCNVSIIIGVRRAAGKRDEITSAIKTTKESEITRSRADESRYMIRMLLLVSLAYVFCSMPMRVYYIVIDSPGFKEMYNMKTLYWFLRFNVEDWACGVLWYINFAVNFYMYFLGGGKKFRNDAMEVIRYGCKGFRL